jgi:hypothetical protein
MPGLGPVRSYHVEGDLTVAEAACLLNAAKDLGWRRDALLLEPRLGVTKGVIARLSCKECLKMLAERLESLRRKAEGLPVGRRLSEKEQPLEVLPVVSGGSREGSFECLNGGRVVEKGLFG